MKLAVVIIHYNSSADLDRCLESLVAYAPTVEHRVIIVDNQSEDEGLAAVHDRYPQFQWIFSQENLGYSKGANLGMNQVEADYYLVLNPDIVVQPGALDNLLAFADRTPRAGIVGPQLLNEDLTVQDSCRRFYTLRTLLLRRTFLGKIFPDSETVRRHLMADFDHQSVRPVDWVIGGCMLVRRSAMERTGPMDERFFLYFEDVDWCYRMWQAGFEVVYAPDARFIHRHRRESAQGKFNRTFWLHLGSLISFYEKWGALVWLLKKWREPLLLFLLWALDMVGMVVAFGAAYGVRGLMGRFFTEGLYPFGEYKPLLLFSLFLATLVFLLTGRYSVVRGRHRRRLSDHARQVGAVAVLLLAATYLGHLEVVSRAVLLLFIPLFAMVTTLGDFGVRAIQRRLEREHLSLERTLLVGPPAALQEWLQQPGDLAGEGFDVAGYVWTSEEAQEGLPPLREGLIPWLGPVSDLVAVAGRYRISQVMYWQKPAEGSDDWRQVAGLRRLRIRLRWHLDEVWLLTSGARAEQVAGRWTAVQSAAGGSVLKTSALRLGSLLIGLLMQLWMWLPGLYLRITDMRTGKARFADLVTRDPWGYDPQVRVAITSAGKVLPLPMQGALVRSMIRGSWNLVGPRARVAPHRDQPPSPLEFWGQEPAAPGLTGPWAGSADGVATGGVSFFTMLKSMWLDPCGFGTVPVGGVTDGGPSDPQEVI